MIDIPTLTAWMCGIWLVAAVGWHLRSAGPVDGLATLPASVAWPAAVWCAFIFVWYLQFKFTGHPGSVDLFTTLTDWLGFHGYEKWMRIGTGSAELLTSILLFIPALQGLGGLGAVAIMTGAIFFHLVSPLGIDPYGDGGVLFKEACSVLVSGLVVAVLNRDHLINLAASIGLYRRPGYAAGM